MEKENELNVKILALTMEIQEKYPELSKYLDEMPVTIPNVPNPKMNPATLQEYYESLYTLVSEYKKKHPTD